MSRPELIDVTRFLEPSRLLELVGNLQRFQRRDAERGREYARSGRVFRLQLDSRGVGFVAEVRGTEIYRVAWRVRSRGWAPACDCPVGPTCKHSYAAACTLLHHALRTSPRLRGQRTAFLPPSLELTRLPPLSMALLDEEGDQDDGWEEFEDSEPDDFYDEDGDLARHVVAPSARAFLASRAVRATNVPPLSDKVLEQRFGDLRTAKGRYAVAEKALAIVSGVGLSRTAIELDGVVGVEDGLVRCHALAVLLAAKLGDSAPVPVRRWSRDEQAKERLRTGAERAVLAVLERWVDPRPVLHEKTLKAAVGVTRGPRGDVAFHIVPLLTTKRLRDDPRRPEQLRGLVEEAARQPERFSPDSLALLHWFERNRLHRPWWTTDGATTAELESLLALAGSRDTVHWKVEEADETLVRCGIVDGGPARLGSGGALVAVACRSEDAGVHLELEVRLGNGRSYPLDHVVYLEARTVIEFDCVIAEGCLWRVHEKPPPALVGGFRLLGNLAVDPTRHAPLLRRLGATQESVARVLARHTRSVPSRAVFLFDHDGDSALRVRLFAVPTSDSFPPRMPVRLEGVAAGTWDWERVETEAAAGPPDVDAATSSLAGVSKSEEKAEGAVAGQALFEYGAGVFQACGSDAPASQGDVWFVEPEAADMQAATDWLSRHCVYGNADIESDETLSEDEGWRLPALAPRFESLVQAWEERPRGAEFFASRRARRLLAGLGSAKPKLDIRSSGKDWFEVSVEWRAEGQVLDPAVVDSLLAGDAAFVRLGGEWVRAPEREAARQARQAIADLGIEASESVQRVGLWSLAGTSPQSFAVLEAAGVDPETVAAARELRRRVESFRGLPRTPLPRSFRGQLRAYQRDGLDFLSFASSLGTGAVLADDMGLGKTVQTLAWLETLRAGDPKGGPALVVCPASVMHNWKEEAARFAPKARVAVLASGRARAAVLAAAGDYDLVITNYALLRLDAEVWAGVRLRALVLDEAQNVKNPDSASARVVRSLGANARLALTGTPLENRVRDVWSIVECVSPGWLGDRKGFEARFDRGEASGVDRAFLSARLRPLMLRRRKSEVAADLPERIEEVRRCELGAEQRRLYLATLKASRRLADGLDAGPQQAARARIQILAALTRLRQICCHPALVDERLGKAGSAKFDLLFDLVEPLLDEGHKVLVFSQFARCIALVEFEMRRRGLRSYVLTGATKNRERVVSDFQGSSDPAAFLISLKAGGTGLNLTAAGYVVLLDPWWNPAVEAQAIDRTHRIGQTRSVMAYRLVASGTIEEKILELQREKAALADAVVDDATFARRLAKEDLRRLLDEG